MVNSNRNEGLSNINSQNHYDSPTQRDMMNKPSYAAMTAINIIENSNQSNIVNQISESLLNMALHEAPLDHVEFGSGQMNFEDGQMNVEKLPQNQNILGNHQLMNNMDTTLASTHVINHLRRNQEQQQLNNNDLAELGERLKSVLTKKKSTGELIHPQLTNHPNDMILTQQPSLISPNLTNSHNNEFSIIPLSDHLPELNSANNLIMTQQQAQLQNHQLQQNFQNFRVNFQNQQYPNNQGPLIDYLNPANYMANQASLNCASSVENYQNRPINLLQSTLIDPSQILLQANNENRTDVAYSTDSNQVYPESDGVDCTDSAENASESQEILTLTNSRVQDDYQGENTEHNASHTSLVENNVSSEKSFNDTTENQNTNPKKETNNLGDIFTRHRRELEEVLKRQQNELHEYVISQSKEENYLEIG